MANMVDEKTGEVLTPEQIAAKALEPVEFYTEFSQNVSSDLDIVARYANKDALIAARKPEVLWEKMQETWRGDAVAELIKAKAKIINDYMDAKERKTAAEHVYIQHLVSTGLSYTDARKQATGK